MSDINDQMEVLRGLGAALRVAEAEDKKTRHGSNAAELHSARLLAEGFTSQHNEAVGGDNYARHADGAMIKTVNDLPDNAGIAITVTYHGKDHLLTLTFDELKTISPDPSDNETLYAQWERDLRSTKTVVPEPVIVQGKAVRGRRTKPTD